MSARWLSDGSRAVHSTCNEIFVLRLHNASEGAVIIINDITASHVLRPPLGLAREKMMFGFWPTCFNQASKALLTCLIPVSLCLK